MSWTTLKIIISYIIVLVLWIFGLVGLKVMSVSAENEHKDLQNKANTLKSQIDEVANSSSASLLSKVKYYEEYFNKKRSIYILEIWWMIEYILPTNNFVQQVTYSNDAQTIQLSFAQSDIASLIKIYNNLEELKSRGLIVSYNMDSWLNLEGAETLLDNKYKLYTMEIQINPQLLEDNSIMIDFLKRMDKYYASIYNWPLKKVECIEYVNETDWETYCKDIDQIIKDNQEEQEKLNQLKEEEEKINKEKQQEIKKKEKEDNEKAEALIKEEEEKKAKEEQKIKEEELKKQEAQKKLEETKRKNETKEKTTKKPSTNTNKSKTSKTKKK